MQELSETRKGLNLYIEEEKKNEAQRKYFQQNNKKKFLI